MNDEIEFYINENGIACVTLDLYNDSLEEIERLNNIINELEKESHLGMKENQNNNDYAKGLYTAYQYMNNKIQELKGDSSNE